MEYGALMEMAVRAGEIMLASGAEVYRVEDTIHRILKHSGIARADVFVVTTGIVATIADASLPPLTLVKRVENRATNLNRIYQVNNVSREFCSGKLSVGEAQERLDRIANTTLYGFWKKCIGYAATTGFFAVMFGGGPGECLVAAVVGVVPVIPHDEHIPFRNRDLTGHVIGRGRVLHIGLVEKFPVEPNPVQLLVDFERIACHPDHPFDQRLVSIAVDHHDIPPVRG